VYNYKEGGKIKEIECSIVLNVEKGVEVGAKHTKIWTSTNGGPLTDWPRN